MRTQYWSCSKLADWLRGTPKPQALEWSEWDTWNTQAEQKHPIRYWIAETFFDKAQRIVYWIPDKLYDFKYWVKNRWVTRTHQLTADPQVIRPGQWCDFGDRILPCLFNELRNYVEVELAWKNIAWDLEARAKYKAPWWAWGWFRWRTWRSPRAGLDYLAWEQSLVYDDTSWSTEPTDPKWNTPTPQAKLASEIAELYTWWTRTRPQRPDPYEVSGWSAWCDRNQKLGRGVFAGRSEQDRQYVTEMREHIDLLEKKYHDEDTEYMCRLIKIRQGLWT